MATSFEEVKYDSLQTLFEKMNSVYYNAKALSNADLASLQSVTMSLPVIKDSIEFNMGDPDVTHVQLIDGTEWCSLAKSGDPSISFQAASIHGTVNDLLLQKVDTVSATINGVTLAGAAYKHSIKKVTGALIFANEDWTSVIILPNVAMFANFVAADGDNPAYFNITVTPKLNEDGSNIVILTSDETTSE